MKNIYHKIITGITITTLGISLSVFSNSKEVTAQSSSFLIRGFANKCLDIDVYSEGVNSTPIALWQCHNGSTQRWTADRDGTIRSVAYPDKCLDANSEGIDGSPVQLWQCHNGSTQKWTAGRDGTIRSVAYPDKCLDAYTDTNGSDGSPVGLWQCHNGSNQKWQRIYQERIKESGARIHSANSVRSQGMNKWV